MFNREEEDDIEDAEFVEMPPQQTYAPPQQVQAQAQTQSVSQPPPNLNVVSGLDTPEYQLMRYERRARAMTIFVRLPVLTFVAFSDKTPGLIRLGAGLLALWEASQLVRNFGEVQAVVTEWQA